MRRSGSCSTRAIICSTPPIRPSPPRSAGRKRSRCGAGSSARKARSRGRRRGLAARLMDVASYDEEGARRSRRRSRRRGRCRRDGWLQRIAEGPPFGPIEALLARGARHGLRARQGAGRGLRPGDRAGRAGRGAWSRQRPPALEALEALLKPLAALGRRLEAVLEDAPDWLDSQARARVEGAISGLAWRRETLAAWIALARRGSAGRPIPISSTGWRSSGSRAANMTSRSTATGSTRRGRSPRRC